jgi:peptidoglycan biosynthesis protein MviN/MurJ (putative lipid II flippase)
LGLALASSCGVIAYAVALFILLNRKTRNAEAGDLTLFFAKITAASALAALASFELLRWLESRIAWKTTRGALLVLIVASAVGFLLTGVLAKALRVRELDGYLKKLLVR